MDNLEKFSSRNRYLICSIFLPMSTVWTIYALPILVSAFSVGHNCNGTNCTAEPGSLSDEFDLIGERGHLADFSTMAFMFGNVIGAVTIPRVSDLRGRRPVLIAGMFSLGLVGMLAAFSTDINMYMILRFIQGILFPANGILSFVLAYESLPKGLREYSTLLFGLLWVLGYCVVAPIAYFLQHWRPMMIACSLPSCIAAVAYYFLVPESFHFMMAKQMEPELNDWLKKANHCQPTVGDSQAVVNVNAKMLIAAHSQEMKLDDSQGRSILVQLFMHKKLLIYLLVLSYLWLCDTFIYYGLSLFSSDLAGDKYVNYVLSGLIEAPSYAVSPYLLNRLGRRLFVGGSHLLAAAAFFVSIFVEIPSLSLVLWLVGKFGVSCAFTSLFVYGSEVFPTGVRSGCIGMCEIVARFGGAVAPAVHSSGALYAPLPRIFFTVVATLGGVLTFVLPETRDQNLPDMAWQAERRSPLVIEECAE